MGAHNVTAGLQRSVTASLPDRRVPVGMLLLAILNAAILAFCFLTPTFLETIAVPDIVPETGAAYSAPLHFGTSKVYELKVDSLGDNFASSLLLFEDGHLLGPAHSIHAKIRERGGGSYSHWNGTLLFSTSDGTDPRTNGHIYSIKAPTSVRPVLLLACWAILLLLHLTFAIAFPRQILATLHRHATRISMTIAVGAILTAALVAFGAFGTAVVANPGTPADAALCLGVLEQACLGCLLALAIWAGGAGIVRLLLSDPQADVASVAIPGFPAGLALLAVLMVLALAVPFGRAIAVALWVASLLPLINWWPPVQQVISALKAAIGIVPFALAFGIWIGLLWHGPTDTLAGSPSGDLTDYAGAIWSLAHSPYPFTNLGYEEGIARTYFNSLYSALGAALLYLPGFDPFLFLLAGGATSYVLFTALMLHFYVAGRAERIIDLSSASILLLAVLVAARYPYWVVESIPVIFVPALTISVLWMSERGAKSFKWTIAAAIAGLLGSALSKVVSAVVLMPLAVASIWRRFRLLSPGVRMALLAIGLAATVYCVAMLWKFIPILTGLAELGPESFRFSNWWFVSRDLATLALAGLSWFVADAGIALALTIGLLSFLFFSFLFQINFVCAAILIGLVTFTSRLRVGLKMLVAAALALAFPAAILSDPAGASSGVVWIVCLGGAVLIGLSAATRIEGVASVLSFRASGATAITALAVTALLLFGAARGHVIADSGYHFLTRPLTPELKDIWAAVRRLTPRDALILTDQVDETINVLGGWNTFAFSGQRQVYLSSYYTAPELRRDPAKLREVLAINQSVLSGARRPSEIETRVHYMNVFAVVSRSRNAPAEWQEIYANKDYSLYRIVP
jgi:hypothetical protein